MLLWPLAFVPERSAMLAKFPRRGRIDALGKVQRFGISLCAQRCKNTLWREWRLVQSNSDRIVNGIRDCGNGRGQRTFAAFFGPEGALGIDAFNDDGFDFGRFGR